MTYSLVNFVATGTGRIILGKSGRCRYCDRGTPEVSFSKQAHAIPQLLGNNEIFSCDECNSCNRFFGDGCDDDLSKYLLPRRTFSQIKGKRGIPSYKADTGLTRIDIDDSGIKMVGTEGEDEIQVNEESNTVDIRMHRQPYSPLGVYKSFLKMAMALAHQELLERLDVAREILMGDEVDKSPCFKPYLIETFVPGPSPMNNELTAMLLQRLEHIDVFSLIFCLCVSNYSYQIRVPCPELDKDISDTGHKVILLHHMLKYADEFGSLEFQVVDLSQEAKVKGQRENLTMHVDRIIPGDLE